MIPAQQQQKEGTDIVIQGRMVWGGVKAQQDMIYGTRNPKIDSKTGQPQIIYKFGLAVPKPSATSTPAEVENFNKVWQAINIEAGKLGVQWGNTNFAWKVDDGDGRKADNTEYPAHSKGCFVLSCKTNFPLGLSAWEGNDIKQVSDDQIKCGDYVQVALNVRGHGAPNAGLYINPSMVCRFAYGEAITNAPSPLAVFGAPPPMPQGASATPIGSMPMAGGMMPPMQAPGQFGAPPPATPQYQAPAPQQQPQYAPNPGVLPPQFQQQVQPTPMPQQQYAPPAPAYQQNPQAFGVPAQQAPIPNGFPPVQGAPAFSNQQPMQNGFATSAPQVPMGFPTFPGQGQ